MTRRLLRLLGRAVVVLSLAAAVLTVGGLAVVNALGQQVMIVASGSMAPEFAAGDVTLVREVTRAELQPGVVVAYHAPGDPEHLTTHRIVSRRPRAEGLFLQTQGDANPSPDPDFVHSGAVVGAMSHSVPYVGRWLAFYQSPVGRIAVLGLPLALLGAAQARSSWRHLRRRSGGSPRAGRGLVAATSAVLVVSVGAGVVLARTTSALFTEARPVGSNTFTSTNYCGTGTTYQQAVVADSPLVYHRFSETTGTNADNLGSAGAGYDGTYAGGYTLGRPGALACQPSAETTAVRLNGTNAQVTSKGAAAPIPTTFSLEIWFRTTTGGGKLIGVGNSQAGSSTVYGRHVYLTNAGRLVFGVRAGTTGNPVREVLSPAATPYLDGRWHHVVATFAPNNMRLYVDGVDVGSRTDVPSVQSYNGWLRIGYDNLAGVGSPPTNYWFTGDLDEAAAYDVALSATRVTAHWNERRN